jgi:hypothetical protein
MINIVKQQHYRRSTNQAHYFHVMSLLYHVSSSIVSVCGPLKKDAAFHVLHCACWSSS